MEIRDFIRLIRSLLARAGKNGSQFVVGASGVGKSTIALFLNMVGVSVYDLDRSGYRASNGDWMIELTSLPRASVYLGVFSGVRFKGAEFRGWEAFQLLYRQAEVRNVLYVGALSPHYQLAQFAKAIEIAAKRSLTREAVDLDFALPVYAIPSMHEDAAERFSRAKLSLEGVSDVNKELRDLIVDSCWDRTPAGIGGAFPPKFIDVAMVYHALPIQGWATSVDFIRFSRGAMVIIAGDIYFIGYANSRTAVRLKKAVDFVIKSRKTTDSNVRLVLAGLAGSEHSAKKFWAEMDGAVDKITIDYGGPIGRRAWAHGIQRKYVQAGPEMTVSF